MLGRQEGKADGAASPSQNVAFCCQEIAVSETDERRGPQREEKKTRLVSRSWGAGRGRRRERRALSGRWSGDDKLPHYSHLNVSGWTSAHLFCGRLKCCPTGSDLFAFADLIESDDKQHKTVNLQVCARSCTAAREAARVWECVLGWWIPQLFVPASIHLSIHLQPCAPLLVTLHIFAWSLVNLQILILLFVLRCSLSFALLSNTGSL